MKKIILFSAVIAFLYGCEKDHETVSKVVDVTYPTITLNGAAFVHIPVGGSYSDQGATLTDDITGQVSQISPTSSELDVNTPGLYEILFEAKNANGFRTQAVRGVLVLNYTPPATLDTNFDISGDYLRAATGVICHFYRMAPGLYITDHVGGSSPVPAYVITPDTLSFDIPLQTTFGGLPVESQSEQFIPGPPIDRKSTRLNSSHRT